MAAVEAQPIMQGLAEMKVSDPIADIQVAGIWTPWLEAQVLQLREATINWSGYVRNKCLDETERLMIVSYDKKSAKQIREQMEQNGVAWVSLLFKLIHQLSNNDVVAYLLLMLDDTFNARKGHVDQIRAALSADLPHFYQTLTSLLNHQDEFVSLKSAKIIAEMVAETEEMPDDVLTTLYAWIESQISDRHSIQSLDVALQTLQMCLCTRHFRLQWFNTNATRPLLALLESDSASPQLRYQILYCAWMLSFETDIAKEFTRRFNIVPIAIDQAKSASKEKIVRVTMALVKNLYQLARAQNVTSLVGVKALPLIENLLLRKWSDEDIREDLDYLRGELSTYINNLSSFDEYAAEVKTGKLVWSPPHRSENFWKNNAQRLVENNFDVLRQLGKILATSEDATVLAIAVYDIGEFIKQVPLAKKYLQDLDMKQRIMELMVHPDAEVKYYALMTVQRMMVQTTWSPLWC